VSIRHEDLWRALDTLAAENGMTPSGLARAAGLDATTFNRSKRCGHDGRPRWPSTESLSRVLAATGASLEGFTALVSGARTLSHSRRERYLRVTGVRQEAPLNRFDAAGTPIGREWERREAPSLAEPGDYGLRIETEAFEPVLCRGDLLMVSPENPIRTGDRVVACVAQDVMIARLRGRSTSTLTFERLGFPGLRVVDMDDVPWMHRITWIGR
jgi:phage repressor protein C with HTH and peptisase S24 domain